LGYSLEEADVIVANISICTELGYIGIGIHCLMQKASLKVGFDGLAVLNPLICVYWKLERVY